MLEGYKTYVVAVVVALIAIAESAGIDIPGADMQQDWLQYILGALGLSALRNAVK